jgi:hypothetical protein
MLGSPPLEPDAVAPDAADPDDLELDDGAEQADKTAATSNPAVNRTTQENKPHMSP